MFSPLLQINFNISIKSDKKHHCAWHSTFGIIDKYKGEL